MSPVSSISIACLRGTLRDSATIGVEQNSPMLTPGVANAAALRRDREIAACDQLAAGRARRPLHAGDHRLRQMHDRLHHRGAGIHQLLEVGAAAIRIAAPRGHLLHVVAGGEGRAVRREHDGAHALVGGDLGEARGQRGDQRFRQAVARLRAVEDENRDVVGVLAQQHGAWCDGCVHGRELKPLGISCKRDAVLNRCEATQLNGGNSAGD